MACLMCNEAIKADKRVERKAQSVKIKEAVSTIVSKTSLARQDQIFYKKIWNKNKDWKGYCYCEECGTVLRAYSASYISHIISRGADTRLRHDERNARVYCLSHHAQFETGKKELMKTHQQNLDIIEELKQSLITTRDE